MGYTCTPQQNITLHGKSDVILSVSSIHAEAFRNSTSMDFSNKSGFPLIRIKACLGFSLLTKKFNISLLALDCTTVPDSNNVIPIAVGVTAAILIVIAIIAFLVGNRRRAQGYQTI